MLYLIAFLLPPLALLLAGKPFQAILNAVLWLIAIPLSFALVGIPLYVAVLAHAVMGVSNHYADKRVKRLERAMQRQRA